jgi:membrane-associated phospholipid phosphatase
MQSGRVRVMQNRAKREEPVRTQTTPKATPVEVAAKAIAPKRARRWRARIFQAYLITATTAFGVLFVLASLFNYFPVDLTITRSVQTINVGWFSTLMWAVSLVGYSPQMVVLVGAIVLSLFIIGLRWEAVTALVAAVGASGLDGLLKIVVHRPRPGSDLIRVVSQLNSYSFPSGHVFLYTAFFGFLLFLGYTLLKPSLARTCVLVVLGSLVALVGLSRIYVGDHWASDVAAAYLLGSLWLAFSVTVYQWGKARFFVRQPLAPERPGLPAATTQPRRE